MASADNSFILKFLICPIFIGCIQALNKTITKIDMYFMVAVLIKKINAKNDSQNYKNLNYFCKAKIVI